MEQIIIAFRNDPSQEALPFPASLSSDERKEIHAFCEKNGLNTESKGKDQKRFITIYKKNPLVPSEDCVLSTEQSTVPLELTDELRALLLKYHGLSIPTIDAECFDYYITLFNEMYDTKQKVKMLIEGAKSLSERGEKISRYGEKIANKIFNAIASNPIYQDFVANPIILPPIASKETPNKTNIYVKDSKQTEAKYFISLDIIKANFSSMRFYNPELVFNCETWEEIMRKFTDIEFFIQSKHFRQVIFGKLNYNRIASIEKYLQKALFQEVNKFLTVKGCLGTDELIISTTAESIVSDMAVIRKILEQMPVQMQSIWRITPFSLEPLGNSEAFIRKNYHTGKIEFKNISKDFYGQAFKFYYKQDLCHFDMLATKDGELIAYQKPKKF